jgi:hypothetical protein
MEQDGVQEIADVIMQHRNKPLEPSRKFSEVRKVTHDRKKRMTADHDGNLGTRIREEDDSRKCLQAEQSSSSLSQEQSMISRASCVARIVCTEPMNDLLKWPDTPKCKGKRQTEQQPFAKTSEKYRERVDKTCLLKDTQEKEN